MLKKELENILKDKNAEIDRLVDRIKYLEEHIDLRDANDKIISENYKKYSKKWVSDILNISNDNYKLKQQILFDISMFNKLQQFILEKFPGTILPPDNKIINQPQDSELSNTVLGEDGKVYTSRHVVDSTIILIESLLKTIDGITGKYFEDDDSGIM